MGNTIEQLQLMNTVMYNIFGVGSTENIEISNIHTNQQTKL